MLAMACICSEPNFGPALLENSAHVEVSDFEPRDPFEPLEPLRIGRSIRLASLGRSKFTIRARACARIWPLEPALASLGRSTRVLGPELASSLGLSNGLRGTADTGGTLELVARAHPAPLDPIGAAGVKRCIN